MRIGNLVFWKYDGYHDDEDYPIPKEGITNGVSPLTHYFEIIYGKAVDQRLRAMVWLDDFEWGWSLLVLNSKKEFIIMECGGGKRWFRKKSGNRVG
jgi:hypothetical protein